MSTPTPSNIIVLADRRPGGALERLAREADGSENPPSDLRDASLWENLLVTGSQLMVASRQMKSGHTTPAHAAAYLFRLAQHMEQMSLRADRLERKYRKAKKKAKR
jgi:hypothetical protein